MFNPATKSKLRTVRSKKNMIVTYFLNMPIRVAAQSKSRTVFIDSNTEILGSNSTRRMNACVFTLFLLTCVQLEALREAD
jgi:hypothetical protein